MAKLLVGIDINNKESNPDFTIDLPDDGFGIYYV